MARFFARILAFVLAVSVFALCVLLLAQVRPESQGGWIVIIMLGLLTLAAPFLVYRAVMGRMNPGALPNEGEGAGLAMGAGLDSTRRRDDDPDPFEFD